MVLAFLTIAVVLEVAAFLFQRSAIEIGRGAEIAPGVARKLLLPGWYLLAWVPILAKWGLALLAWRQGDLLAAIALVAIAWAAKLWLPVPHRLFAPVFQRRVSRSMLGEYGREANALIVTMMRLGL